ncbi:MAG: helix-turn-helix domain-containing protein [Bacteroidales bacterium]
MKFGKRLRKLRNEAELTQEELAKKIGVSRATVAGYETKGKEPPYSTLQKLSDVLGCSTDYLLGRTNERKSPERVKEEYENKYKIDNPKEIKELLEEYNVHLDGEVLSEKDKQDMINVLKMLRERNKDE